VSLK